jgi:type II secretory ATPase GspE/PulE/Tfp pilus assembly ATPase PilB-like protein
MFVPNRELGSFLVDARLMSRDELARLLGEEDANLFEVVRSRALVPEDDLTRAASFVLGVPFGEILHDEIDPDALLLVPEPLSRAHSVALFKLEGHRAHVGLTDLDALNELSFLETERHLRVVPRLTDRASLKRALLVQQKRLKERFAERLARATPKEAVDALVSHALLSRAREIYLEPLQGGGMRVRYRIDGVLRDALSLGSSSRAILSLLKDSAGLSLTLLTPQEGRMKLLLHSGEVARVGVFTLPAINGENMHLTVAPESAHKKGFALEALGLHGEALAQVHQALARAQGLVLVSSPKTEGKTTTLYTLADLASHASRVTLSIEEHVRLPLPQITQVEVKHELGATIASALKAALRHNPDTVMIDEIKKEEEATLAASAASRGIFALAGLTADSAANAIQKMLALEVDPLLLSATLRLAVGERVVRTLCTACREAYVPTRAQIATLEGYANFGRVLAALKAENILEQNTQWKDVQFYKAVGCEKCDSGYQGQTALFEVLPVSAITKELILDKTSLREEQASKLHENVPLTLAEDGLFKAAQGLTTIEEVWEAIGE